jgi:hypothetical protein
MMNDTHEPIAFGAVGTALVNGVTETNRMPAKDEATAHDLARRMIARGWEKAEVKNGAGDVLYTYTKD